MKKKLVFIFRDPRRKQFSIEEIFTNLSRELSEEYNTENYFWDGNRSLLSNIRSLRSLRADHYHITGDVHYAAMFFRNRITMTLHDIGYYENVPGLKRYVYSVIWIILPVLYSKGVNTISNFTKSNFEKHFPPLKNRLRIIHNPLNPLFIQAPLPPKEPFTILHIGTGENKNLAMLVEACKGTEYLLKIVGKLNKEQKRYLEESGVIYESYFNLDTLEIIELYRSCHMVFFVSLYEGFGMPVIEAQATGRPVVVSRLCSLPEVAGDTAFYVEDPKDPIEIREAIHKLSTNKDLYAEFVAKGLKNVERFRIEKVAKNYADFFKSNDHKE